METKHTPGKWQTRGQYVVTQEGYIIADCAGYFGDCLPGSVGEANTCLIATAPESLEVLKRIERIAMEAGGHGVMIQRILTEARAAIANATA